MYCYIGKRKTKAAPTDAKSDYFIRVDKFLLRIQESGRVEPVRLREHGLVAVDSPDVPHDPCPIRDAVSHQRCGLGRPMYQDRHDADPAKELSDRRLRVGHLRPVPETVQNRISQMETPSKRLSTDVFRSSSKYFLISQFKYDQAIILRIF